MSLSSKTSSCETHIALLPSAGAGHLLPCLRFAATLIRRGGCRITLLIPHPTVSNAELHIINRFLSSYDPHIATAKDFHLHPTSNSNSKGGDSFWLHVETIRRSAHLLSPLLSSLSPPPSVFLSDVALASAFVHVIPKTLHIPIYGLFVSSALMFSLISAFPTAVDTATAKTKNGIDLDLGDSIGIPGRPPIPTSFLPPVLLNTNSLFATIFLENGRDLKHLTGVFINTFEALEPETLEAATKTTKLIPIGPLLPGEFETTASGSSTTTTTTAALEWLHSQPEKSVMYVSFGNRTAAARDQLKELGEGLVLSGFRFLWVVKLKMVDKDESEELSDVLGGELMERVSEKGSLVVKDWVDQTEILGHVAVGGFLTHVGWNSVIESLWEGVPMLTWPQGGDQRINAAVVEECGAGVWPKSWGWCGEEEKVVGREEIAERVREVMRRESVRVGAARMKEAAREAVGGGGGSTFEAALMGVIKKEKYY